MRIAPPGREPRSVAASSSNCHVTGRGETLKRCHEWSDSELLLNDSNQSVAAPGWIRWVG